MSSSSSSLVVRFMLCVSLSIVLRFLYGIVCVCLVSSSCGLFVNLGLLLCCGRLFCVVLSCCWSFCLFCVIVCCMVWFI